MSLLLFVLFVIGACLGGQLNWAIYRWAWNPSDVSPWSRHPSSSVSRTWPDRIPIIGWWRLRREVKEHGDWFWLRPMLIEIAVACGLPMLYWWEIHGQLLPPTLTPTTGVIPDEWIWIMRSHFLVHTVLLSLMIIATFIDIDEKTIPDQVTIPGTLLALIFAAAMPYSLLPILPIDVQQNPLLFQSGESSEMLDAFNSNAALSNSPAPVAEPVRTSGRYLFKPLLLNAPDHPRNWPVWLDSWSGLGMAFVCCWGWCYGLLPMTLYFRRGIVKAFQFWIASIARHPISKWIALMGLLLSALIVGVWLADSPGSLHWPAMLSALVGLAVGGGVVWSIRIVAGTTLGQEAMGFGDVTLMAMIGAFLGWQSALLTFFIAPFVSLAFVIIQISTTGKRELPFGPFLCVAAAIVLIGWSVVWSFAADAFSMGLLIPLILAAMLPLMAVLLALIQLLKRLFGWQ